MKLSTAKTVVNTTVGLGAASIATQIIKNNVVPGNLIQKITITSAMLVIGMMAGEKVGDYTDKKIDEVAEAVNKAKMNVVPIP